MSLTDLLVPSCAQNLRALSGWIEKAAAHARARGAEEDALLPLRLAPDMFPLASQVRFACFLAQEPVHRLRGEPLPERLLAVRREGFGAGERPGSLAEARAHVADALSFLGGVGPGALDGAAERPVALDLPTGKIFDMTGSQYMRDWALPQLYFHLVTAYAILRNHGVELGKADFASHMFAYQRPGSAPRG